jgi:uncharacterized membrane protein YbaN (DUF454 family)
MLKPFSAGDGRDKGTNRNHHRQVVAAKIARPRCAAQIAAVIYGIDAADDDGRGIAASGALMSERGQEGGEDASEEKSPARILWLSAGMLSMSLGVVGIVLPLLPTTPFMILAAWCFARSSPRLREKLVNSRMFGPSLQHWQRERAIARRAKISASVLMSALILLSIVMGFSIWVVVLQLLAAVGVLMFIWSRPDAGPRIECHHRTGLPSCPASIPNASSPIFARWRPSAPTRPACIGRRCRIRTSRRGSGS